MGCIQKNSKVLSVSFLVVGAVLVTVGCVVKWQLFPSILNDQVEKNLELKNGTEAWTNFLQPPVPIYMNFYLFNVTNPLEVVKGAKPILNQMGPYVYEEHREKQEVMMGGESQIYYREYRQYIYNQEQTNKENCKYEGKDCSMEDKIHVLNPIMALLDAGWQMADELLPPSMKDLAIGIIKSKIQEWTDDLVKSTDDGLIFSKPVNDILYNGVKTTALDRMWTFATVDLVNLLKLFGKNVTKEQIIHEIESRFPQLKGGTFGIFKGRNDTTENMFFRVDSGGNNLGDYLSITQFNGNTSLPSDWWAKVGTSPSQTAAGINGVCHDIKGTDGTMFAPGMDKTKSLWVFVSELCRSIWLDFDSDQEVKGISAHRYRPPPPVFNMSNADNYCYCPKFLECAVANKTTDTYDNSACPKIGCTDGLINVGKCLGGAPIFMSSPHFYNADATLLQDFEGLAPNQEDHDTVLDVDPITGLALNARKRIQVNFPLTKTEDFNIFKNINQTYRAWPIFWADENAQIDDANADKFKSEVQKPISIVNGVSIGLGIVCGGVLILVSLAIIIFVKPSATYPRASAPPRDVKM